MLFVRSHCILTIGTRLSSTLAMRFAIPASLVIACATLHSASAASPQAAPAGPAQSAVDEGLRAMRAGQLGDSERAFRRAVQILPQSAEVRLDLGLVLMREGKLNEAVETLRETLRLNPQAPGVHQFLGMILFNEQRPDEARTELQAELSRDPKNLDALMFLGQVELAAGHTGEAAAAFERAYQLAPANLDVLEQRGGAYNQLARDSYAQMARLSPDDWHVHRVQALLYSSDGRHADAIVEYEAALKQQPNNPDLQGALGDEYRATSQLDRALEAYLRQLQLAPGSVDALYNAGSTRVETGNAAEAIPLLQQAAELAPHSARTEYYLGRGLAGTGQDAQAAEWFQKASTDDPEGEIGKRSYFELARVERKLHHASAAEIATAGYNRIRAAQQKAADANVERFRSQAPRNGPDQP